MPDVVIDFLNNLHDAEENGEQVDLTFEIGFDRDVIEDIDAEPEDVHFDKYHQHMYEAAERYITIGRSDDVYDPVINLPVSKQDVIVDISEENISPLPEEIGSDSIQGVQLDVTHNHSVNDVDTKPPDPDPGVESASVVPPRRAGLRPGRVGPGTYTRKEYGMHLSAKQAVEKLGNKAKLALVKEIKQLLNRRSWHGIHVRKLRCKDVKKIIPSKMFVNKKYTASGVFDKV